MNEKDSSIKLTAVQQEILEELRLGGIIIVDRENTTWLGDRIVQFNTMESLTENKLITRRDKSKSVKTKGNGYVISEKGLAVLSSQVPRKKTNKTQILEQNSEAKENPATERQLAYAKDLGIEVPLGNATQQWGRVFTFSILCPLLVG